MDKANNKIKNRESFPDFLNNGNNGIDQCASMDDFAADLLSKMGFGTDAKPVPPVHSATAHEWLEPRIETAPHPMREPAIAPAGAAPQDERNGDNAKAAASEPVMMPAAVPPEPATAQADAVSCTTGQPGSSAAERGGDHDEAAIATEAQVRKKNRGRFFAHTPGAHIRFILIVLGILMLEMVVQGYLGSIGLINPIDSWF